MNTITVLNYNGELINFNNVVKVYTHTDKFDNKFLYVETASGEEYFELHRIKEYVIS